MNCAVCAQPNKSITNHHAPLLSGIRLEAFLSMPVDLTAQGCWLFQKGNDYGIFKIGRTPWTAHRLSYRIFIGEDVCPRVSCVHHICENKRCVNPDHLEAIPRTVHYLRHHKEAAA